MRWWVRRIAVWDGNRIATGIAGCAWLTNVGFLIHSKSTQFSLYFSKVSESSCTWVLCIGVTEVNLPIYLTRVFEIWILIFCSSTLCGCL